MAEAADIAKTSIDLGLVTGQLDAMLDFYQDTLGLPVEGVVEMPRGGKMTRLKIGDTVLKLVTHGQTPEAKNPPNGLLGATGIRYFTITVSNLVAATQSCKDAGYKVPLGPLVSRPGVNIAMIEDPDGNWVELLQLGEIEGL